MALGRLSDDDLHYLKNPMLEGDRDRKYRERLRGKISRQLADFTVINHNLRETDLEQIFYGDFWTADVFGTGWDDLYREHDNPDEHQASPLIGPMNAIEFIYRGFRKHGATPDQIYQLLWRDGVRNGEAKHRGVEPRDIKVWWDDGTFKADVVDVDEMTPIEKWQNDMPLTGSDVEALKDTGAFDSPTD